MMEDNLPQAMHQKKICKRTNSMWVRTGGGEEEVLCCYWVGVKYSIGWGIIKTPYCRYLLRTKCTKCIKCIKCPSVPSRSIITGFSNQKNPIITTASGPLTTETNMFTPLAPTASLPPRVKLESTKYGVHKPPSMAG